MSPQPGWFPDSNNPQLLRWWDGQQWTEHTHFVQQTYTPAPEQHIPVLSPEPKNKSIIYCSFNNRFLHSDFRSRCFLVNKFHWGIQ